MDRYKCTGCEACGGYADEQVKKIIGQRAATISIVGMEDAIDRAFDEATYNEREFFNDLMAFLLGKPLEEAALADLDALWVIAGSLEDELYGYKIRLILAYAVEGRLEKVLEEYETTQNLPDLRVNLDTVVTIYNEIHEGLKKRMDYRDQVAFRDFIQERVYELNIISDRIDSVSEDLNGIYGIETEIDMLEARLAEKKRMLDKGNCFVKMVLQGDICACQTCREKLAGRRHTGMPAEMISQRLREQILARKSENDRCEDPDCPCHDVLDKGLSGLARLLGGEGLANHDVRSLFSGLGCERVSRDMCGSIPGEDFPEGMLDGNDPRISEVLDMLGIPEAMRRNMKVSIQ